MHFNLPLTRALHDLAPRYKMIAWTHDLTVTNPDYSLPNPNQMPWNLMRTPSKEVIYVATSDLRAAEMKIHLKFSATPQIIPNMVDPARLFGCTADVRKALLALEIPWRDFAAGADHGAQEHRVRHRGGEGVDRARAQSTPAHHRGQGPRQRGGGALRRVHAPDRAAGAGTEHHFCERLLSRDRRGDA
jgi:hypothetical protein